ncbi:hypothetical protein [Actinacidiphila glaucinigra]|uniref:hypothetical protein n=1 Tax=Actinacidiphila glaucinigra TaxID=235986 RepID=UPI003D924549
MTPSLVPLYLRSRRLPGTAAALAVLFAVSRWGADRLVDRPFFESGARVPVVVLVPVLVAAVTGLSLHSRSGELDRSAPLQWWRWRGAHLLALTGLAALWLGTALPGDPAHFGAPTLVRGVLGFTGLAAAGAALLGARLSWLPPVVYGGTAYLAAPAPRAGPPRCGPGRCSRAPSPPPGPPPSCCSPPARPWWPSGARPRTGPDNRYSPRHRVITLCGHVRRGRRTARHARPA